MPSISLSKVIEKMNCENLTPEIDISKIKVNQPDINRPALQMAGYFEHFDATRLQVIGFVEYSYMLSLDKTVQLAHYEQFLSNPIPGVVFCRELQPDDLFREIAVRHGVPLLMSKKKQQMLRQFKQQFQKMLLRNLLLLRLKFQKRNPKKRLNIRSREISL